jgi:metallo-beta-lactamase class B
LIVQNIETLGFSIKDVRFILNSHAHYDHTGGLAALQRLSSAVVKVSAPSAKAFLRGNVMEDDPQYGFGPKGNAFPAMKDVRVIADQQVVHVGDIALTAQFTPGHTPGGTSWTWQSCEGKTCLNFVFADSLSPFSTPEYHFSGQGGLHAALANSIARIAQLPCDIMMTTHPMFFNMAEKAALAHQNPTKNPFIDPDACAAYAAKNKSKLARKLAKENQP